MVEGLNAYSSACHLAAKEAGWWPNGYTPDIGAMKIALIHSEISEALEGIRKNSQDVHLPHRLAVEVELADALIRIFDLAGALDLDLDRAVKEKIEYNKQRLDHKLENRSREGGKKF
jgi:NTP pyrophosphatase (non-canonical NTP hydrolase)